MTNDDDVGRLPRARGDEGEGGLPEHETRETESEAVGAGLMSAGGTAVDRGTGELAGRAEGSATDEDASGDEPADPSLVTELSSGAARPAIPPDIRGSQPR